jgi:hypothetical protein
MELSESARRKKWQNSSSSPKAFLCFFFTTRGQMIWMEMKARGYLGILFSTILLVYYTIHTPADVFELIAIVEEREGLPIDMK